MGSCRIEVNGRPAITQHGKFTTYVANRITCNGLMMGQAPEIAVFYCCALRRWMCGRIASVCRCREQCPESDAPTCSCSPALFMVHAMQNLVMHQKHRCLEPRPRLLELGLRAGPVFQTTDSLLILSIRAPDESSTIAFYFVSIRIRTMGAVEPWLDRTKLQRIGQKLFEYVVQIVGEVRDPH